MESGIGDVQLSCGYTFQLDSLKALRAVPARPAKSPSPSSEPHRSGCNIKGNINRKGERIYHMPGGRSYAKTVIDTTRGERWFCSEAEAKAAAWRPAKQ